MISSFHNSTLLIRKVYELARPYGRARLLAVLVINFVQGVFQVIGVSSIFPFLALATNPAQVRNSSVGATVIGWLPEMSDRTLLIASGCAAIALLFVANGVLLLGEMVRVHYAQGLGHWLRLTLLNRIVSNPYSYFLHNNTGELLKKAAGDVTTMVNQVLLPLLDGTSRLITVILMLAMLVLVDPFLAVGAAVCLGTFYFVVFALLSQRRKSISERFKAANKGAMREAQQLLAGIKPIKIHQKEKFFIGSYAQHSSMQAALQKWIPLYQNSPRYLVEPIAFGGLVAIVVLMAAQGQDLATILPKLGVMALAGYRLLPNLQLLYGSASQIGLMSHTVEEVHDEFRVAGESTNSSTRFQTRPTPLPWQRAITIENVTFRHSPTAPPLFDNLSLEIPKNSFVAFVGATGSGKSTLVDLLLGLHTPQSGRILIDGAALHNTLLPKWRASLGYVPQEIFLVDNTIAANIAFGVPPEQIDHKRVAEVARVAQIADFIERELPQQYHNRVGERGVRLSGGQRQRIGLARALYHQPTTLFLDEATSALDTATETLLMKAIEALHGQLTIVVIAHRLSTIEQADILFVLERGRLVQEGKFNEVYSYLPAPT